MYKVKLAQRKENSKETQLVATLYSNHGICKSVLETFEMLDA